MSFSLVAREHRSLLPHLPGLLSLALLAILVGGGLHLTSLAPADEAAPADPAPTALSAEAAPNAPTAPQDAAAAANPVSNLPEALAGLRQLAETAEAIKTRPEPVSRVVELESGDTLTTALRGADIEAELAKALHNQLAAQYDLRKLRAGQEITLNLTRRGEAETLDSLTLQPEPTIELKASRVADGSFKVERVITPLERRRFALAVTINGSLQESARRAGLPRAVTSVLTRIYAHQIDFQRDIKAGDVLEVFYEQGVAKDGKRAGEATVIYANLRTGKRDNRLYRVIFRDGSADYFNEKGEALRRGLLRTPVEGVRMSSGFGMRRHPILGYSKMHTGVDFAGPIGTPILAAGDGVVTEVGWQGAYGRAVEIKHNNKVSTLYAHMSRFARGLAAGDRVRQGEVIGYIGSSGRSTGPHLHYEVRISNKPVNPLTVTPNTGRTLDGPLLVEFKRGVDKLQRDYRVALAGQQSGEAAVATNSAVTTPTTQTAGTPPARP